ncbi:MAG: T9SS type A sorting domain-containing protein [Saprospiraceae bacterium]|nr:T9SS type A sorting domain-containing protein [Saprospiraceae bacterium]
MRIAISDMNGQMVHLMNTEKLIEEWQYEWDASHLPKGSYTVQIMTKEGGVAKLWIRK